MLKSLIGCLLAAMLLVAGAEKEAKDGWKPTPLMRTVSPDDATAGDTLTITGEYLDKSRISDVYLTMGDDTFKLQMISQSETKVVVKVPAGVKTGRLRFMVLTSGLEPQFLEQPIMIAIR